MLPLLLLPLLWGGESLQEEPGYELQVQKSVTVQEGLCVLCPALSYPESPGCATNNLDGRVKPGTRADSASLGCPEEELLPEHRGCQNGGTGSYFFHVERGRDPLGPRYLPVSSSALIEKPDIHFLEPLESGRPTRLSCSLPGSCEAGRPLTFSWTGNALSPLDPETTRSSELTLTPRPEDHGTNLTCRVKRQGAQVTTERTVQLNVSYAPQNLAISIFFRNGTGTALRILSNGMSVPIQEGQSLFLACTVDSNPPASLSWFREGKALNPSQTSMSGTLELPNIGAREGGEFTCRVQHPLGSQHLSFILSVQRSSSSCICVTEKQQGSWPLVLTLIRGALMGAGFLLTYGLTWIYYTRCGGPQQSRAERPG
uniref:Sialic acid binding Ig like lectin 14 n=1 Tax=Pan troglodytes TaxID=9598 RepID=A0A2I3S4N6_PANTR